uniref:Uncharacterized protein n=1 Tax=viral metagenome TaxID=1070528 RepID=A0A6C0CY28_9ZZZZ
MSGQTDIGHITNSDNLSKEEEEIVDSILSEINEGDQQQHMAQQHMAQQQMAQQQMAQQQMAQQQMAQQQMAQQQMAQQQMAQQQMAQQQMAQKKPYLMPNGQHMPEQMMNKMGMSMPVKMDESPTEKLIRECKEPLSVLMLVVLLSMPQIDEVLVKSMPLFDNEGSLSLVGLLVKGVIGAIIFYILKIYS